MLVTSRLWTRFHVLPRGWFQGIIRLELGRQLDDNATNHSLAAAGDKNMV